LYVAKKQNRYIYNLAQSTPNVDVREKIQIWSDESGIFMHHWF